MAPEIAQIALIDLKRTSNSLKGGRRAKLTAEQVVKYSIIKQMTGLSYRDLELRLKDSIMYHAFLDIGFCDDMPSFKVLHKDISALRPETYEMIKRAILKVARGEGIELIWTNLSRSIFDVSSFPKWGTYRIRPKESK